MAGKTIKARKNAPFYAGNKFLYEIRNETTRDTLRNNKIIIITFYEIEFFKI